MITLYINAFSCLLSYTVRARQDVLVVNIEYLTLETPLSNKSDRHSLYLNTADAFSLYFTILICCYWQQHLRGPFLVFLWTTLYIFFQPFACLNHVAAKLGEVYQLRHLIKPRGDLNKNAT